MKMLALRYLRPSRKAGDNTSFMDSLRLIKHSEATSEDILQVIAVKQKAWPYPLDSQKKWIEDNLSPQDIHVFLVADGNNAAYMNLVKIQVCINDQIYNGYGIGNVCASIKGCGFGNKLVRLTNNYLVEVNKPGLLFCHTPLIRFYSSCNWELLPSNKCIEPVLEEEIHAMTFNAPTTINSLKYIGKFF